MTILNKPPTFVMAQNASSSTLGMGVIWPGGPGAFSAEGTFGGGTITLQVQTLTGTWVAVGADTTFTSAGIAGFLLPNGSVIRALIATATAVYAYATPIV